MTEKLIKNEHEAIDVLKKNKPKSGYYMLQESVDMAIQALEEIQAYRAIGTVEEIKSMIRKSDFIQKPSKEELVAELQELSKMKMMLECYESIGTIEEFKDLKQKSVAKKPFQPFGTHSYKCPSCWKFVAHEVDDNCDLEAEMAGWCPYCGQKIDWQ